MIDAIRSGRLNAEIALVISNNRDSGALHRAADNGLRTACLSAATHPDPCELDQAICSALVESQADIVVLAGYMKKIGPLALAAFSGRIINTHPSLLPKHGGKGMYGPRVYEAVLANGDSETGVTVHLVDAEYDTGPIIAQATLPVAANATVESLKREVQALERQVLCATLQRIAEGDIVPDVR